MNQTIITERSSFLTAPASTPGPRGGNFHAAGGGGGGFASALRRAETLAHGGARSGGESGGARAAAEEFVSITLVQPILAQMRSQNNGVGGAAAPFAPGDAERAFAPLWDAEIAARITKAQNFAVVDAVARKLLERSVPLPAQEAVADGD